MPIVPIVPTHAPPRRPRPAAARDIPDAAPLRHPLKPGDPPGHTGRRPRAARHGYHGGVLLGILASLLVLAGPTGERTVRMRVDASARRDISPFVYGLNFPEAQAAWGARVPPGVTLSRFGGNRTSAYNWETNASNCGNDCGDAYSNDAFLGGGADPGGAVRHRAAWAQAHGAAFLATVPMLGWVAGDTAGAVPLERPLAERRRRFVPSRARKGAPFAAAPDLGDGAVFQDEFVDWLERAFPGARGDPTRPIFYSLDNEPDLWGSTHEEVRGDRLGKDRYVLTGYQELVQLSAEYAAAVKGAAPHALVFGPALSTWNGFANLYHNDAPDPAGRQFFLAYYLDGLRAAGERAGRRLLDVLDVHWYPAATSARWQSVANEWAEQDAAMIEARVQAPRSLWDPTYRESSWVQRAAGGPIALLPRLQRLIDEHAPGTRIAITEYCWFRGGDISGALAQADALGIFGREGVFAAALWPQGSRWAYGGDLDRAYACTFAAFRSYRDYDGRGAAFGDVSLRATTSDAERTSLYASADARDGSRVVLIALNKSAEPVTAEIEVAGGPAATRAEVYLLTGGVGACSGPARTPDDPPVRGGALLLRLPPRSVSTIVLRP